MSLPQKEPGAHKTILLVHSDIDFCSSVGDELKSRGYGVVIAQDGEVGMTLFDMYKDQVVLVLLDIILPKKDGLVLLKDIKEANSSVPVIVLTNLEGEEDKQKSIEAGASDYIIKSKVTPKDIGDKVENTLK